MKFSALEEYGLRCLIQLARRPEEVVTIAELAEWESLTAPQVGKLMGMLRRA